MESKTKQSDDDDDDEVQFKEKFYSKVNCVLYQSAEESGNNTSGNKSGATDDGSKSLLSKQEVN